MKLNIVALAALAFGSTLVLAAPFDPDMQDLAAREAYDIEDFIARDFTLEDLEAFFARGVSPNDEYYL